jgi:hypothetical protein
MGYEYKIETYDSDRTKLPEYLRRLPEFLREDGGSLYLGNQPDSILVTVRMEADHVYICQHVASRETDALLGLVTRRLLSSNDHVVISEI